MMNTRTYPTDYRYKRKENNSSLVELLAILLIGGISIYVALLGLYFENDMLYVLGLILVIISIGTAAVKFVFDFMNAYLDFKDRLKNKDK